MYYVLGYNLQFDKRTGQNKYQQLQKNYIKQICLDRKRGKES